VTGENEFIVDAFGGRSGGRDLNHTGVLRRQISGWRLSLCYQGFGP
jgi:hypothetical protein